MCCGCNNLDKQSGSSGEGQTAVPAEVLARADGCRCGHGCCRGNGDRVEPCRVTSRLGKEMLFVESEGVDFCAYRQVFGFSHLCACPVRYHLFETEARQQ